MLRSPGAQLSIFTQILFIISLCLTDQVVDDVGERPDERHSEERNAEQDDVQHNGQQQVGEPYSSAVHHPRVGVHLAVSYAHIHL